MIFRDFMRPMRCMKLLKIQICLIQFFNVLIVEMYILCNHKLNFLNIYCMSKVDSNGVHRLRLGWT